MFDDKMTDEEIHEWRSSELYDALKYGTRDEVIDCLKQLDSLDGELLEILVEQLDGSTSSQKIYRNSFQLVAAPGRPPSIASVPLIREGIFQYYRKCREKGMSSKEAVFATEEKYAIKRTLIMQVVREAKGSQK
jgi:hypothetical protein